MPASKDFAYYCCDLLASAGRCVPKRMFGGFGVSIDGLTIAIIADLGDGEKLWLKADDDCRARYEAAGCARFSYPAKGVARSMNYYSAPDEAMDSQDAMRTWALLALDCALKARCAASAKKKSYVSRTGYARKATKSVAIPAAPATTPRMATTSKAPAKRSTAAPAKTVARPAIPSAARKSAKG